MEPGETLAAPSSIRCRWCSAASAPPRTDARASPRSVDDAGGRPTRMARRPAPEARGPGAGRPPLRPRARLPGLRRGGAPADAAALLVQLAARRLPDLPGLRPGDRHRPRAGRPRPAAHASPSARSRPGTRRPTRSSTTSCFSGLQAPARCRSTCRGATCRRRPRVDLERAPGELRQTSTTSSSWLEGRTYKVHVRVLLARYRSYTPCPDCGGTPPEARGAGRAPRGPDAAGAHRR